MSDYAVTTRVIVAISDADIEESGSVEGAVERSMRSGGVLDIEVTDPDGAEEPS